MKDCSFEIKLNFNFFCLLNNFTLQNFMLFAHTLPCQMKFPGFFQVFRAFQKIPRFFSRFFKQKIQFQVFSRFSRLSDHPDSDKLKIEKRKTRRGNIVFSSSVTTEEALRKHNNYRKDEVQVRDAETKKLPENLTLDDIVGEVQIPY